ncbi:MAG: FtsX-like permease family protein, partial [Chloroflexota bacterium]|nr:FtsX-like permease family protein [Chloroflexota bacterium]
SLLSLLLKRLRSSPGLSAGIAAGLTAAVALVTCIPLYADGVGHRLLMEQLSGEEARPPFAFLFRYVGAWHGALEWEDIQAADAYLTTLAAGDLGLPLAVSGPSARPEHSRRVSEGGEVEGAGPVVRHVRTGKWRLFPADEAAYADVRQPLEWLALGFLDGLTAHIDVIEGDHLPSPPTGGTEGGLPVLISQSLANRLGLRVEETYVLFEPSGTGVSLPIRITGIWQPRDQDPSYWLYPPRSFDEILLTSEAAFRDLVTPAVRGEIDLAAWYLVADGSHVTSGDVPALLSRIAAVRATLDGYLPHATLDVSPEEPLLAYRQATGRLTLLLYAFGIPIVGLVLYFVTLVAGMMARRQQGETVVLRSRGTTRAQVMGLYLLQGLLLGLPALALGWPLGWASAALMARTRSFLDFTSSLSSPLSPLTWAGLRFGIFAVALSLLAVVLPALATARHTIVTHQQELARALRRPWWQRYFLDLGLLLPALYGYVILRRPGALPLARLTQGDLFANPLLFLVPALFIFAWALVLLRFLPRLMDSLARLSRRARGAVPLLLFHDLSRQAGHLAGPLLLLVLTTGLATFSASVALTLDLHLHDQVYYRVGADLWLAEQGETTGETQMPGALPSSPPMGGIEGGEGEWVFLPITEHLELPGAGAAARIGDYPASASLGGQVESGRFVGLDRLDFPGVAFFRPDFAPLSLGALMNELADDRSALLVERGFLARHGLQTGDPLHLTVDVLGERAEVEFVVAGALDLFPTLYPEDGPFFVGNLRYLFERLGGLYPYDVWLATEPGSTEPIVAALNERGVPVVSAWDARNLIAAEQQRPERQGLFGLLTLGFLASGLLTVLGLTLHALLSFRERTVELGVLRAVGFSQRQMRVYLAGTQIVLLLTGLLAGTALGLATGRLFIPFLQAQGGLHSGTPPFIVRTAWGDVARIYALFAATAAASIGLTLALLRRMRVYEAIKMGETE